MVINIALFSLSAFLIIFMRGFIARIHGKMFGVDKKSLDSILYGTMAVYKILIIFFNVVPYFVLKFLI